MSQPALSRASRPLPSTTNTSAQRHPAFLLSPITHPLPPPKPPLHPTIPHIPHSFARAPLPPSSHQWTAPAPVPPTTAVPPAAVPAHAPSPPPVVVAPTRHAAARARRLAAVHALGALHAAGAQLGVSGAGREARAGDGAIRKVRAQGFRARRCVCDAAPSRG